MNNRGGDLLKWELEEYIPPKRRYYYKSAGIYPSRRAAALIEFIDDLGPWQYRLLLEREGSISLKKLRGEARRWRNRYKERARSALKKAALAGLSIYEYKNRWGGRVLIIKDGESDDNPE